MLDEAVLAWFQAHRDSFTTAFMLLVSQVHSTVGLLLMTTLLMAAAWARRQRDWAAAFAVAVPGAMLLNVGLKHLVQRARPVLADPVIVLETYSFPSGHAAGSAALYAALAAWLVAALRGGPRWQRGAVVTAAVLLTVLVSLARVILGVHFLSDVLAGMGIGAAFSLASMALMRRWFRRRREPAR